VHQLDNKVFDIFDVWCNHENFTETCMVGMLLTCGWRGRWTDGHNEAKRHFSVTMPMRLKENEARIVWWVKRLD